MICKRFQAVTISASQIALTFLITQMLTENAKIVIMVADIVKTQTRGRIAIYAAQEIFSCKILTFKQQ